MQLSANGKDYTVEFTFEAAESEVVNKVFDYFSGAVMMKDVGIKKAKEKMTDEEKIEAGLGQMKSMLDSLSDISRLAIDFLYMGLLEHHGNNEDGDGSVTCRDDAKRIYKQFCKENPDDSKSANFGLYEALRDQMEIDGFFKRIGLDQMMSAMAIPEPKVIPQDHKKKTNTKRSRTE